MKATLVYTLPKERAEFECANKGVDLAIFQEDVVEFVRSKLKDNPPNDAVAAYEEVLQYMLDELVPLVYWR
jgi:hypothetical protein